MTVKIMVDVEVLDKLLDVAALHDEHDRIFRNASRPLSKPTVPLETATALRAEIRRARETDARGR